MSNQPQNNAYIDFAITAFGLMGSLVEPARAIEAAEAEALKTYPAEQVAAAKQTVWAKVNGYANYHAVAA